MAEDIGHQITKLEKSIVGIEEEIAEYIQTGCHDEARKAMHRLETDLKYLSVLANGAPINKEEDRRIMDFLRIHYSRLRTYSLST